MSEPLMAGFTEPTQSVIDEVVARPGEQMAHIAVLDADGVTLTVCGEFTHLMTRRLLMDALDPAWRCPGCFEHRATRYPQFVCTRCGHLVSTRPDRDKVVKRVARVEGGWDHALGACP